MARSLWKGSISFGLVNIPVALYPGEQNQEMKFTMLDKRDMSPVGYKRFNKTTGAEVAWEQIVKGYEYDKDQYVVMGEEEFRRANVKATQTIEIIDFVNASQIPPIYFDRPYYVEPVNKIGEKGYALLRETLKRTGRAGIANVVIRTRQHLAMLVPVGNALVLNLLRYHHELRQPDDLKLPGKDLAAQRITKKEIEMAERLVEDMAASWEPDKYKDEYRDDLMRVVEEKVAAGKTLEIETASTEEPTRSGAQVIDFMSLLKQSVEQKEKARGTVPRPTRRRKSTSTPSRRHHSKRA